MQPNPEYFGPVQDENQVKDVADGNKAMEEGEPNNIIDPTHNIDDTIPAGIVLGAVAAKENGNSVDLHDYKVSMLESCGFPIQK